jgi:thiosulfate reductase/polysulfide reductase chain A
VGVHTHTTIRPEVIRETARFMAGARPASLVHPGRHVTWYGDDTQRSRAIAMLNALLGAWGRKGGFVFPEKIDLPKYPYTKYTYQPRQAADMPKDTVYPLADSTLASGLCDASIPGMAEYDIKGWLGYGTNLIQALPAPEKTKRAIQALDLIVAVDVLPMEITGWADIVLPEATYLERCDEVHAPPYKTPFLAVRQKAVEPMYDSKPGWWIAKELAHRIGLADYFPWEDSEEYAKYRVKEGGFDCEQLMTKGVITEKATAIYIEDGIEPAFNTPSGKIELHSTQLADAGFDPMPVYTPPEEPPPGYFRLLFGRAPVHTFGGTTNNRFLSEVYDQNEVWLNARTANEMGLADGELVTLINQDDVESQPIRVKVTQRIRHDCVYMVHGYGHTSKGLNFARGRGADDAKLITKYKTDPIMGGTGMNVNFVRIERAAA